MPDNQMFELLDNLKKVNYETLDIDDFLDQRECEPFDSEWIRVYQAIEELKKERAVKIPEKSRKKHILQFSKKQSVMTWQAILPMTSD